MRCGASASNLKIFEQTENLKACRFGDYFDYIEQAERLHLNMADEQVLLSEKFEPCARSAIEPRSV